MKNAPSKRASALPGRALALAALILLPAGAALAAESSGPDAGLVKQLVNDVAQDNYSEFIASGSPQFQKLTQARFDQVAAQIGPRLKSGNTLTYLGELHEHGDRVSLWKITFSDGGDDALATLARSTDGKVDGFWIR